MFTDAGFEFLIQAPSSANKITTLKVGTEKAAIVDLNPPKTIAKLQSILTSPGTSYTYNLPYGSTNTFTELDFNLGRVYTQDINFYNSYGDTVPDYYEFGLSGDNGDLLYYHLNTNNSKTFAYKTKGDNGGFFIPKVSVTNPVKDLSRTMQLNSEGVLTDYLVEYSAIPYVTKPYFTSAQEMTCYFKTSGNNTLLTGQATLETFNSTLRTATIHLTLLLDSSKLAATNYIHFESRFCSLRVDIKDPITLEPVAWPLTDGESLIIPLQVYLGEVK